MSRIVDLLIVDHGPSSLLASRGAAYKHTTFSSGFFVPPRTTPMPRIRPDVRITPEQLPTVEKQVLSVINAVAQTSISWRLIP